MSDVDRLIEHVDLPDNDPFGCLCDICNQEAIDRAFAERESLRERMRTLDAELRASVALTDADRRFISRVLLRNTAGPDRRYAESIVGKLTGEASRP